METQHVSSEIEARFGSLGFAAEVIPQVLARINLDEEVEFVARKGVLSPLFIVLAFWKV